MSVLNISTDKWDRRWMIMAQLVATWSKDPTTRVGAVVVRERRLLVTGYNGFPARTLDDPALYDLRPSKLQRTVHAEANCVGQAALHGMSLRGATIFSTLPICSQCAGLIIQAGIARVVIPEFPEAFDAVRHEYLGWETSMNMFDEAAIILDTVD